MNTEKSMDNNISNIAVDFNQIDTVTDCLKVLSNPDRLKILCVLINSELNVQQIQSQTGIHQPTLSQQLTILRVHKMVSTRREGKQIYYQLTDLKVMEIMEKLYQLYCQ